MLAFEMGAARSGESLDDAFRFYKNGRYEQAENTCRAILRGQPGNPDALHLLGLINDQAGIHPIAVALIRKAIAIDPDQASFHHSLGGALLTQGKVDDAIASFRRAIALDPGQAKARTGLGNALLAQGKTAEAIACFREALSLAPDFALARTSLGKALVDQGKSAEAIACFREALALAPDSSVAHSCLLFTLHYCPSADRETLFSEARAWGERHAEPLAREIRPHQNVPDPARRLRVGYVSADFRQHPVGYFFESVLSAHDRTRFEVFCYSNGEGADDVTARIRSASDHWRSIRHGSDEAVAELIRSDAIDILVDLSGHTGWNRLLVFARKPAPVQATWLGYIDTTGVRAIDYIIGDSVVCPEGDEGLYVEEVVRLPGDFLCYTPRYTVDVAPPPALSRGYPTFGCFNNLAKVTPDVVALWAQVLRALPDARICLKAYALDDPEIRDHVARAFVVQGIAAERVRLLGRSSHADYLAAYAEVDVALDPFPYNGGTTTIEALWMGVPVVSLLGDRFSSRMGASHLSTVGLSELIAESPRDYVDKAVALARDLPGLAALRSDLRDRLLQSSLGDRIGFARGVETVYREIWRQWCQSHQSQEMRDGPE